MAEVLLETALRRLTTDPTLVVVMSTSSTADSGVAWSTVKS